MVDVHVVLHHFIYHAASINLSALLIYLTKASFEWKVSSPLAKMLGHSCVENRKTVVYLLVTDQS